jgi:hypothetical protein
MTSTDRIEKEVIKSGDTLIAFRIAKEWHYSYQNEIDPRIRADKWDFLRTHKPKHFYQTNEELLTSARRYGLTLIN